MKKENFFERKEIKFPVNNFQRAAILLALKDFIKPDPNGESTICNVYYDTPDFRLIRHSLEKPLYREKIRVRSYGQASPEEEVFLEMKSKYLKTGYKRRISIPLRDAEAFLAGEKPLDERYGQIKRELTYRLKFYKDLEPAVYMCYDRAAYYAKNDHDFRITFDNNIRWRTTDMSLASAPGGHRLLKDGESIMEIKTTGAIPIFLARILNSRNIQKVSFSKYGKVYEAMLADKASRAYRATVDISAYQKNKNGAAVLRQKII